MGQDGYHCDTRSSFLTLRYPNYSTIATWRTTSTEHLNNSGFIILTTNWPNLHHLILISVMKIKSFVISVTKVLSLATRMMTILVGIFNWGMCNRLIPSRPSVDWCLLRTIQSSYALLLSLLLLPLPLPLLFVPSFYSPWYTPWCLRDRNLHCRIMPNRGSGWDPYNLLV